VLRNLVTLGISGLIALGLGELALRLVLDPVDYLYVEPAYDPVLAHKIDPGQAGHDDWGYRNPGVPDQVDILAIGDSMTYGLMAKMRETWPYALGEVTGKSVYNAGMGGYGPLQYMHVLKTRAPALQPDQVIVMLYPGNDLMDSYNLAYSFEHWADYRPGAGPEEDIAPNVFIDPNYNPGPIRLIRDWLAQNSVFYRLVLQLPVFDSVRQREALGGTAIEITHQDAPVVLDPARRLALVDMTDPRMTEAFAITTRALGELAAYTRENDIALHVILMPVREQLFLDLLPDTLDASQKETFARLDDSLKTIEAQFAAFFQSEGIAWTNLRPVLEAALSEQAIFPSTDGHPNAAGYTVIARTLLPIVEKE
jgi:hypothetical protein